MATQSKKSTFPPAPLAVPGTAHDAAKAVLAAGGLLAAFGVASCCALPLALSLLGISAASLVGVGYMAARYQHELFYAAVICLWPPPSSCGGNGARGLAFPVLPARARHSTGAAGSPLPSPSDSSLSHSGSSRRYQRSSRLRADLPRLWHCQDRNHADERLPVLLRMHRLPDLAQAQAGRLLRVLLLRVGALPAGPAGQERRLLPRLVPRVVAYRVVAYLDVTSS